MESEKLLRVRNLRKYYPVKRGVFSRATDLLKAVDGVSFSIEKGRTFGLVGESGCGKTTLGRCVIRLIEPTSGKIEMDGINILELSATELRIKRRRMQMIFQDPYGSLNPRMTVEKILEEPLIIHRLGTRAERRTRVEELLVMVGLDPDNKNRYPHEFSGGQRQRIGIARAIALNPDLIVADEPVSALDVSVQGQILNLLKDLQQKLHLTFLFIAHDLSIVQYFSDTIAVMYLGKIVELAPNNLIFQDPLHPYTNLLLNSVPVADPGFRGKKERPALGISNVTNHGSGCRFQPRCPVAIEECKLQEPPLREIRPGHWAACHLHQPAVSGATPEIDPVRSGV